MLFILIVWGFGYGIDLRVIFVEFGIELYVFLDYLDVS